uniref:28S ribosomal protein S9, mitochondrial n=1 Tax=Trichuris muris TaxID=70415 RepID=A0A5S6QCZ7_TRIMR
MFLRKLPRLSARVLCISGTDNLWTFEQRLILHSNSPYPFARASSSATRQPQVPEKLPLRPVSDSEHSSHKITMINKAMAAYIKTATEQAEMMSCEVEKYELGKRHLANMMGIDADTMTQEDIDKAIAYLFPSGLFSPRARPVMKHPELLFPRPKAAEFGMDGRPFHPFFYTINPGFYQIMFDCAEKVEALKKLEDEQVKLGRMSPEESLNLAGTTWISLDALQKDLGERISEAQYNNFIVAMNDLASQPYSYRERDFLMQFRVSLSSKAVTGDDFVIPEIFIEPSGRQGAKAVGFRRKHRAEVLLLADGTGKVSIDGRDLGQLCHLESREVVLAPFMLLDCLGKYDVEAHTSGGGESTKAGAVRHGISQALCAFVDEATREKLRLAGLLTRDRRRHERKKFGQPGARRKWTWKKR